MGRGDKTNITNTGTGFLPVVTAARVGEAPARGTPPARAGARFDIPDAKAWLSPAEAAAEVLPGFNYSEQHIRKLITDGLLATRPRHNAGKGRKPREFHWTSLPPQARDEYLKRHGVQVIENDRHETSKGREAQRGLQAEARFLILKAIAAYITDHRMAIGDGMKAFCTAYARQRTRLDPWVYNLVTDLTVRNLRDWARLVKTKGPGALEDGRARSGRRGFIEDDARLRAYIIKTFAERPHLAAPGYVKAVRTDLGQEVSLRTMQAFLKDFRDQEKPLATALTNPDKARSHYQPAFGSLSASIVRLNQRWEIDATRADANCLMPDGTVRRCAITALIDVRSRRAMCLVSDQGRALGTMALLRRAILAWGLPEVLKADNGKDFVAASVQRFCRGLGIEVQLSRVFTPEQKGHIERFFGTMNRELFELLPGYVGHNVNDRAAIRARESFQHRFGEQGQLVIETSHTPEQLQARIDVWLANTYEQRIHSGLDGHTPANVALALADQVRPVPSPRALDGLLMDAPGASGIRVVGKKGIQLSAGAGRKRWYVAAELGALAGYRVHVSLDPADDGRVVVYNVERTQFICVAEDAAHIDDNRSIQIAHGAKAARRAVLRLVKSDVGKMQKLYPGEGLGDRILADTMGDGFILQEDARIAMETAARPQLVAAERAVDALIEAKAGSQPQDATAEEQEAARSYLADMTPLLPAAPATVQCDGYVRPAFDNDVDWWAWAERHQAQGMPLDAGDQSLWDELKASPAFAQQLSSRRATPE